MDFGVQMFPTVYSMSPAGLAKAAESRGFESLFFPEHTHIPASRLSRWPGGDAVPQEYWHGLDPYAALATAAAVTTSIRLGTGVTLVTERDPIVLAKQVATLDCLSNGRVLLGVGAGWNVEEMANHGVAFENRWHVLRERILAMRAIWTAENAEFHGEFVDFDPIWLHPKPIQPGGPKILVGASSPWTYRRVAEYGDGWFPIYRNAARVTAQGEVDYAHGIERTRDEWQAAGRDGAPDFSISNIEPDRSHIESLMRIGFNRVIFKLPTAGADSVIPLLDRYAAIAYEFNG